MSTAPTPAASLSFVESSIPGAIHTNPEIDEVARAREIALEWGMPPEQFAKLLHGEELTPATARPLIALAHFLERAYPGNPEQQVEWLSKPNPTFDQNKPIDVMMSAPEALNWVVYCLESAVRFK